MQPAKYRFYLNDTEVFPVYKNLTKKLTKDTDNLFFRTSIEGDIYLYGIELDINTKYVLTIQVYINGEWKEYCKSTFSKTDCEINYDKGYNKIKLSELDEYTDVLNNQENTYNLLDLPIATKSVRIDKRPMLQIYIPGVDTVGCFLSNIWFEQECTAVDSENELINTYKFGKTPETYKYVEVSGENPGMPDVIYDAIVSTYMGVLTEETSFTDLGWTTTISGVFKSVENTPYQMEITFTRFISNTDVELNRRDSLYRIIDTSYGANNNVLFEANYAIATGGNSDESKWENDTFTLSAVNVPATGTLDAALFTRNIYARWVCDVDTYDGKATSDIPLDDFVMDNRNYRKCVPWNNAVSVELSTRTSSSPTVWGRADNDEYFMPPNEQNVYYPISRSIWGIVSFWRNAAASASTNVVEKELTRTYTMRNAYEISSCIQALLKKMGSTLTHEGTTEYSEFLYSDVNPVVNRAFHIFITQKTNILKGEYDQPAQKAETTFKALMDILKQCFRCYWFVDNGKLRIEHISWFLKGGGYTDNDTIGIDLTAMSDIRTRKLLSYAQNTIKYNKDELTSRYEFDWAEDCSSAFAGKAITAEGEYLQKDKNESIMPSDVAADVDFMLLNPNSFSEDGFALLGAEQDGTVWKLPYIDFTFVDNYSNMAYNVSAQNGYMAWSFLELFYMWDMPSLDFTVDGALKIDNMNEYYTRGVKRIMTQTIKVPYEEDPDTTKLIKTEMGSGQIDSVSIDMNTKQMDIDLLFEPS